MSVENSNPYSRRHAWALSAVLLTALALRVGLLWLACEHSPGLSALHAEDTASYIRPARALLATGTFSRGELPEVMRTPGYPLLLLPGIALGHVELVTVSLQILLSLATVALVYRIGCRLTQQRSVGLAAALLLALEPLSAGYCSLLIAETLFTVLWVLAIDALLNYMNMRNFWHALFGGVCLALATYVRPVTYFLPFALAAGLLVYELWRCRKFMPALTRSAAWLTVCVVPLLAWQARNAAVANYTGFSAITDWNLYFYNAAGLLARQSGKLLEQVQAELGYLSDERFFALHPELRASGQAARFHFLHNEGQRIIAAHPFDYAQLHLQSIAKMAVNPAATDVLRLLIRLSPQASEAMVPDSGILASIRRMRRSAPLLFYANMALAPWLGLIYVLAIGGCVRCLRMAFSQTVLMVSCAGYLMIVCGGSAAVARFRHPVMPLICVLAGVGAVCLHSRIAAWRGARRTESLVGLPISPRAAAQAVGID